MVTKWRVDKQEGGGRERGMPRCGPSRQDEQELLLHRDDDCQHSKAGKALAIALVARAGGGLLGSSLL